MDYLEAKPRLRTHSVSIDQRARMLVTGVSDVERFHEQEIVLITEGGPLRIEGEGLHLAKLSLEEGQVAIEGEILLLEYEPPMPERRGLFSRFAR